MQSRGNTSSVESVSSKNTASSCADVAAQKKNDRTEINIIRNMDAKVGLFNEIAKL